MPIDKEKMPADKEKMPIDKTQWCQKMEYLLWEGKQQAKAGLTAGWEFRKQWDEKTLVFKHGKAFLPWGVYRP